MRPYGCVDCYSAPKFPSVEGCRAIARQGGSPDAVWCWLNGEMWASRPRECFQTCRMPEKQDNFLFCKANFRRNAFAFQGNLTKQNGKLGIFTVFWRFENTPYVVGCNCSVNYTNGRTLCAPTYHSTLKT